MMGFDAVSCRVEENPPPSSVMTWTRWRFTRALLFTLLFSLFAASAVDAQSIFDRAKRVAEREIDRRTERAVYRAVHAAFDAGEEAVECVFTDPNCIEGAQNGGSNVVLVDEDGNPVDRNGTPVGEDNVEDAIIRSPAAGARVEGANANYDFVPGERVLFYEDYSNDRVGNFPQRLEFVRGNWEIVEWQGRRLLRNTGPRHSALRIPLPETLPERFTIETEAYFPHGNQRFVLLTQPPEGQFGSSVDYNFIQIAGNHGTGVGARSRDLSTSINKDERIHEGLVPVRIIVDGQYVKTYIGEHRTSNIPNAVLPRSNALYIENIYFADEENPMYLGPIRVAASGVDLYDALTTEGRVVTEGVLFDTASATLKPESFAVIQEIAAMLQEHPELRVRVEGHTDNEGDPASNMTLSENRANAVQTMLIGLGIDASRLEAAGLGQTQPVADNGTPEGRRQNRRVELVML